MITKKLSFYLPFFVYAFQAQTMEDPTELFADQSLVRLQPLNARLISLQTNQTALVSCEKSAQEKSLEIQQKEEEAGRPLSFLNQALAQNSSLSWRELIPTVGLTLGLGNYMREIKVEHFLQAQSPYIWGYDDTGRPFIAIAFTLQQVDRPYAPEVYLQTFFVRYADDSSLWAISGFEALGNADGYMLIDSNATFLQLAELINQTETYSQRRQATMKLASVVALKRLAPNIQKSTDT